MTSQKPKPLFPLTLPPISLPVLSIEEPSERIAPAPIPVVCPLGTISGGTSYVTKVLRSLPTKLLASIFVSQEVIRQCSLSTELGYMGEVTIPEKFVERELDLKLVVGSFVVYDILGTKYDGYSKADVLAVAGYKYDGYSKADVLAVAGYKYDGYSKSSVSA